VGIVSFRSLPASDFREEKECPDFPSIFLYGTVSLLLLTSSLFFSCSKLVSSGRASVPREWFACLRRESEPTRFPFSLTIKKEIYFTYSSSIIRTSQRRGRLKPILEIRLLSPPPLLFVPRPGAACGFFPHPPFLLRFFWRSRKILFGWDDLLSWISYFSPLSLRASSSLGEAGSAKLYSGSSERAPPCRLSRNW